MQKVVSTSHFLLFRPYHLTLIGYCLLERARIMGICFTDSSSKFCMLRTLHIDFHVSHERVHCCYLLWVWVVHGILRVCRSKSIVTVMNR